MRSGLRLIIALVVAIVGAITYFSSRSTNEVTGEVQHISISPDQEVALGLQAAPEMASQFGGVVDHPVVSRYVEEVGERLVRQSEAEDSPYKFDFHLLRDEETINAFALPGGQIFLTVGLLMRLNDEAELAGVLGHEIGHVVGRHGAEHLSKQQFAQTLVGAVGVATYDPENPGSAQTAAIAAAVAQMVNMKFGREDELESDELGVQFMKSAGYDPGGLIDLMHVLAKAGGERRAPEFFSTHPNPENRMARIQAAIAQYGAGGETNEARFREKVLSQAR